MIDTTIQRLGFLCSAGSWAVFHTLLWYSPSVATTLRILDSSPRVKITVLRVKKANKHLQVCKALEDGCVKTAITVLADNDVEWPSTLMPWLLALFEDDSIGGVGTCQRVKHVVHRDLATRIFNWLRAAYIERRNFEISATHNIGGGTSYMSRRTGLYEREYEIKTTLETNTKSNWRSNWTSLVYERHYIYTLYIATFTSLAFVWGMENWQPRNRRTLLRAEIAFMFGFTKVVKLVRLLRRNPRDIMFLPVSILFSYFYSLIKLYTLFTLKETSWGSRESGDEHNTFPLQEDTFPLQEEPVMYRYQFAFVLSKALTSF
ncbi:hypothetical protein C8A01DRAFT_51467 [Parachaetomium inaequale]|uniref:Uncharacterized protein n=1 Tax=Parachaetomium inaequale TaxID=2588326 RepID=A0AAN6SKY2_9PEZI|nr:hypothetical protein C8A01DRAFT_51467 [Parachaetomium inaequale]